MNNKTIINIIHLCKLTGILKQLHNRGYLKIISDDEIVFTDKAVSLLEKTNENIKIEVEDPSLWVDDFLELFPKGVQTGNYYVRGDKKSCIDKLRKFSKKYPEYDKTTILKATTHYVEKCRSNRWQYMQLSQNFIFKNNVSTLAAECANIMDDPDKESSSFEQLM